MSLDVATVTLAAATFAAKAWRDRRHRKAVEGAYVEAAAATVTWAEELGHRHESDAWHAVFDLFCSEEFAAAFGVGAPDAVAGYAPPEGPASGLCFSDSGH